MMRPSAVETPHLRLEPWGESHTELLVRLSAIPEVTRFIGTGEPWPRAQAQAVAATARQHWARHGFGWRAAVERTTDQPVGFMGLNFAGEGTAGLDAGEYEIGWWLEPDARGRGLAREGGRAVCREAFEQLGAPSVIARIQPANRASIAVAEAVGLARELSTTGRHGEPVAVFRLRAPARPAEPTTTSLPG